MTSREHTNIRNKTYILHIQQNKHVIQIQDEQAAQAHHQVQINNNLITLVSCLWSTDKAWAYPPYVASIDHSNFLACTFLAK
jgi:aspartate 1-decarboxylase